MVDRRTDARDKVVLVCEMLNTGEWRFSLSDSWGGEVVSGAGKGIHFEFGETFDGEVGEKLVLRRECWCKTMNIGRRQRTIHLAARIPP